MWRIKLDQNRWPTVDRTVAYLPTPMVTQTHTHKHTCHLQTEVVCKFIAQFFLWHAREIVWEVCVLRRWMFSALRAERRRGQVFHVLALKKSPNLNTGSREIKGSHLCCKRAQVVSEEVTVGDAERARVQGAVFMTSPACQQPKGHLGKDSISVPRTDWQHAGETGPVMHDFTARSLHVACSTALTRTFK